MPTAVPAEALRVSISDSLADLLDAYVIAGRAPSTVRLFSTHVGGLMDFLAADGITSLDEVRSAHITRYLARESKRGLKPASLHVILRTIRRFMQWNVEQGNLTVNVARAVMAPSVIVEPVVFMNDKQVGQLLGAIGKTSLEDYRDAALFRVLASGMRRGELVGLRVTDLDLDNRTLTIRPATSKTRTGRTVAISRDAAAHLRSYLRVRNAYVARTGRQDDGALWISAKGTLTANGALQALWRRCDAAGLPRVSLHSFRHRFAATAVASGMPMGYLCAAGGWSKGSTLPAQRYGMFGVEDRALDAMKTLLDR